MIAGDFNAWSTWRGSKVQGSYYWRTFLPWMSYLGILEVPVLWPKPYPHRPSLFISNKGEISLNAIAFRAQNDINMGIKSLKSNIAPSIDRISPKLLKELNGKVRPLSGPADMERRKIIGVKASFMPSRKGNKWV